jgi:hypothetical protein
MTSDAEVLEDESRSHARSGLFVEGGGGHHGGAANAQATKNLKGCYSNEHATFDEVSSIQSKSMMRMCRV